MTPGRTVVTESGRGPSYARQMAGVSLLGVGDVFNDLHDGLAAFRHLEPLFSSADIVFGNLEGVHTDRPAKAPTHKHYMGTSRERGAKYGEVGFDVMTCANNHMIDGGYVGMDDTLELLRDQGIAVTGAGPDLSAALTPAVLDRNGCRFAFLGFCTTMPKGYEARQTRPGVAPLRVVTTYLDPDENFWEPGVDAIVRMTPMAGDLELFRQAIQTARGTADVVVVAPHWGYSSRMELLHDYEIELARDAVAHGADVVLCTHHHSLRAVEIYRGRPIFYGLNALVHHFRGATLSAAQRAAGEARFGRLSSFVAPPDEFELWPFAEDTRQTMIAVIDVSPDRSPAAGFVPARMLADGSTEPLRAGDPRAAEIARYVDRITSEGGFSTAFELTERDGWAFVAVSAGESEAP
jgi:poly-gamma-glutamate capsule biosynthesis protein CapA/YwtB (metallophosphatase superfamily)